MFQIWTKTNDKLVVILLFSFFFFLNVNVIKYVNSKLAGFVYVLCKLFITIKYSQSKHVPFSLISIMIWIYKVRKLRVTSRLYEIFGKFLQQLMVALFSYFNLEYQTLCNEEIKWLTCRASYWELIVWSVVKEKYRNQLTNYMVQGH